ncbi:uncharacterized protein LOC143242798 [Tachypleus tridentatus]|uniref:uncharacterized protein LOC143242798 n=1 Tax=Tachypleus tridentatus TaxID=6853 RepID=UPI003FCF0ED5
MLMWFIFTTLCLDVCAFTENLETCERDFADCVTGENGEASCECKPSFVKSEDGSRCKLAGAAYIFHMTLKNRYNALSAAPPGVYFTESFNRKQLLEDIKSTMEVQYGDNFEDAVISDVKLVGGELYSSVSLQFTKEEMSINKITSDNVCRSQNKNDSYCIIPPSLVVNKEKLKETKIEPINQCSSPRRICPIHTDCVKHNENIEFSCTCKKHFKMIYGFSIGKKGRVEYCEDINECDSPNACPKFATCVNTIGSYSCPCDEGYKLKSNNDDPKKTDCIGVCSDNPCGKNGQCVPTNSDKFYCKCDKGYAGFRCTERDTFLSAAMKNTVVVGAVLGSALLLLIIGTTLVIYRLKRRKRISGKRNEIR